MNTVPKKDILFYKGYPIFFKLEQKYRCSVAFNSFFIKVAGSNEDYIALKNENLNPLNSVLISKNFLKKYAIRYQKPDNHILSNQFDFTKIKLFDKEYSLKIKEGKTNKINEFNHNNLFICLELKEKNIINLDEALVKYFNNEISNNFDKIKEKIDSELDLLNLEKDNYIKKRSLESIQFKRFIFFTTKFGCLKTRDTEGEFDTSNMFLNSLLMYDTKELLETFTHELAHLYRNHHQVSFHETHQIIKSHFKDKIEFRFKEKIEFNNNESLRSNKVKKIYPNKIKKIKL